MIRLVAQAARALRIALAEPSDPVEVALLLPRLTAEKVLALMEAENASGAVVVPVKEQFTTTEAAKLLGISRSTLMKLIESGEIDSVKVASHHRIPAPAIRKFEHARGASLDRAAEAMEEFANEVRAGFQNNVDFGGQD